MSVSPLAWIALAVVVIGLLTLDFIGHARSPHPPTMREATGWTIGYVALAVVYGLAVWGSAGRTYAGQFYAGWLTEWSLSVDNLFVFILIMSAFRVPRSFQQKALLLGIATALVLRLAFILAGAALVERFGAVFYVFGAFLVGTAVRQVVDARQGAGGPDDGAEPHLPQPADWGGHAVEVEEADAASTLRLYRDGLRLRRRFWGAANAEPLEWVRRDEHVLAFARGRVQCWTAFGADVELPAGEVLLASAPLGVVGPGGGSGAAGGAASVLPADTTAWIRIPG